jgi:hypothetical protein
MMSDPFYGSIALRTLSNIVTGETFPNLKAGHAVPASFIEATTPGTTRWRADDVFAPALSLLSNPDVAAASAHLAQHYLAHGRREERKLRP